MQPRATARHGTLATLQSWGVVLALAFLVAGTVTSSGAEQPAKTVLVIYPDTSDSRAALLASEAVRARFSDARMPVEMHTEFLDRGQFPSVEHRELFVRYLVDKYAGGKPDAILAFGADSLETARRYREAVGSDVPIVFCVMVPAGVTVTPAPNSAGIVSEFDVARTLSLARKLQPEARNLVVVAGTGPFDAHSLRVAREQLAGAERELATRYLIGLPNDALQKELAALPRDTIVILLSKLTDGLGQGIALPAAGFIAGMSSAPVYAPYSTYFGQGIVGGYMDTFEDLGAQTADLAISILKAHGVAHTGSRGSVTQAFRVDARQMERWRLVTGKLPADTILAFRSPPVWESHPTAVMAAIGTFTAMASILVALLVQIALRKRAEANLEESERRMRFAAAAADVGLWHYDRRAKRLWSSRHCRTMLGLPPDHSLTAQELIERVHPDDAYVARAAIRAATFGTLADEVSEFRVVWPNGETRWLQARGRTDHDESGEVLQVSGIFRDVTNYKTAQLEAKQLSQRILSIQDDERQRIAQDLHDSTSQHLAAVGLNLIALKGAKGSCSVIEDIERSLEEAAKELRTFTYLLHPPALADDGLTGTLTRYVEGFRRRSGLHVALRCWERGDNLSRAAQESILRIVQEALANIHRHASASRAWVHMRRIGDRLHIVIRDNGVGLHTASGTLVRSEQLPMGVGIAGMTARTRHLGGELQMRSTSGGTTVHALIPVGKLQWAVPEPQVAAE